MSIMGGPALYDGQKSLNRVAVRRVGRQKYGRPYFDLPDGRDLQSMVLEVRGGANVGTGVMRDLRGVLERETARGTESARFLTPPVAGGGGTGGVTSEGSSRV